jgi:signal transduction histidine kinase
VRRRLRSLPLGAWLALGFALAVAAPALSAGAAWWAVGARQQADADGRLREASVLIAQTGKRLQDPGARRTLQRTLAELHVEADLQLSYPGIGAVEKPGVSGLPPDGSAAVRKAALVADGAAGMLADPFVTQALAATMHSSAGKRELTTRYETHDLASGPIVGTLFVERPSGAVRLAAACAVGLVALALALIAGVVLLRRWIVAPLSRLAADAERIAGGELDVTPINSRTREVAEVGAALRGMADGLRGALAEQHAAEQQRRFLISAIAHDLRTPLFTLRGSLEAIEHGIGDTDHLRRAQDKATLLDRLVGDLFTYSRLEYAGPELAHEALDPVALAHEAADTVDPRIAVVAAATPMALDGDHAALLRVLVNLLDNAVRHARSEVELRVRADGEEVLFEVLDDGPGIAPDDLPQLFEPLFRADRTRNSATGGAGLGLAIVQRLTAAHGGDVQAENRPEGGARFVVRYPRRRPERTSEVSVRAGPEPAPRISSA